MDQAADPLAAKVRLDPIIDLIAKHEPSLAQKLQTNLDGLPFRWETLFTLAAPFTDAASELPAGSFAVDGKSLRLPIKTSKKKEPSSGLVVTAQTSPANAEARVTFQH